MQHAQQPPTKKPLRGVCGVYLNSAPWGVCGDSYPIPPRRTPLPAPWKPPAGSGMSVRVLERWGWGGFPGWSAVGLIGLGRVVRVAISGVDGLVCP